MQRTFLEAEWRKLVMANYAVDTALLLPYLPRHTEFDLWNNTCYVSLVGFMFLNTRLKGFRIPFHSNFEEVNLRFYVRHRNQGMWKRGVVFIKEIVPKPALTFVANAVYKEKYETFPMRHRWDLAGNSIIVEYAWKCNQWHSIRVVAENREIPVQEGSEEEFITAHFWGYTKVSDEKTSEYEVTHPRWNVYPIKEFTLNVNFEAVYGAPFSFLTNERPNSVFLAEGSTISVKAGKVIGTD